jgi:hypothetical protein
MSTEWSYIIVTLPMPILNKGKTQTHMHVMARTHGFGAVHGHANLW